MRATRPAPPRRTARLRDVRGWVGGAARATPRAAHRKLRKLRPRELHHTHLARLLVILFWPRPTLPFPLHAFDVALGLSPHLL